MTIPEYDVICTKANECHNDTCLHKIPHKVIKTSKSWTCHNSPRWCETKKRNVTCEEV